MRSAHPTGGRPLVILSGGPRSRAVYFEDEWLRQHAIDEERLPDGYVDAGRTVKVGAVHQYRTDERLAECDAAVWVHETCLTKRQAAG